MIEEVDALRIARAYLASEFPGRDLVIGDTVERPIGWGISYNFRKYVETGDFEECLIGPGPLLVLREDGRVVMLRTFQSVEKEMRDFAEAMARGEAVFEEEQPAIPYEDYIAPDALFSSPGGSEDVDRARDFTRDMASRDESEGLEISLCGWFCSAGLRGVARLAGSAFQFVFGEDLALVAALPEGFTPKPRTWYLANGVLRSMGSDGIFAGIEIASAEPQQR